MPDKNVLPTTDERLDEHLHLAIIGLRQTHGHIDDAMNLLFSVDRNVLANKLGNLNIEISKVLSIKTVDGVHGLIPIREDIKAKIKAEESK
ncbi:hypothetical protein LCGC14_1377150 [marine sediment metagenome]|uniref:Uncharacterized protein n=1 Tax=marine sediment metagenome TaxID=412755 RepID=A0A0F9K3Q9_9ZZZZ